MIITNRAGLSPALVHCANRLLNAYDKGDAHFTPTQLVEPVRIVILRERHDAELQVDVQDVVPLLLGQLMHLMLEAGAPEGSLAEQRFYCKLNILGKEIVVGGKPDIVLESGDKEMEMHQYKLTSARAWINGMKPEWIMTENVYRRLLDFQNIQVANMYLDFIFKDWHYSDWVRNPIEYPSHAVERLPVEPWPFDKTDMVLTDRVAKLVTASETADEELPFCTAEERWCRGEYWSVRKEGNKRATKRYSRYDGGQDAAERDAAGRTAQGKGQYIVDYSPPESVRCRTCHVKHVCNQYQTEVNPAF
jgi:hypothetical protein